MINELVLETALKLADTSVYVTSLGERLPGRVPSTVKHIYDELIQLFSQELKES